MNIKGKMLEMLKRIMLNVVCVSIMVSPLNVVDYLLYCFIGYTVGQHCSAGSNGPGSPQNRGSFEGL